MSVGYRGQQTFFWKGPDGEPFRLCERNCHTTQFCLCGGQHPQMMCKWWAVFQLSLSYGHWNFNSIEFSHVFKHCSFDFVFQPSKGQHCFWLMGSTKRGPRFGLRANSPNPGLEHACSTAAPRDMPEKETESPWGGSRLAQGSSSRGHQDSCWSLFFLASPQLLRLLQKALAVFLLFYCYLLRKQNEGIIFFLFFFFLKKLQTEFSAIC